MAKVAFTVSLPVELRDWVVAQGRVEERSASEWLRRALEGIRRERVMAERAVATSDVLGPG